MPDINSHPTLVISLQAAVPMWMLKLDRMGAELREQVRMRWAADGADEVAAHGDTLQFGSKKKGETARVFNALAKGLAAAAYQPGGITVFGEHWCANHQECLDAAAGITRRPLVADPDQPTEPSRPARPVETVYLPGVS